MLKTIRLPNMWEPQLRNDISEIDRFIDDCSAKELVKKSGKLSMFWKMPKSKKLSKSRNLPKFDIKKAGSSFLNPGTREAFDYL